MTTPTPSAAAGRKAGAWKSAEREYSYGFYLNGALIITDPSGKEHKISQKQASILLAACDLLKACKRFVRKVDKGYARSKNSYAEMKAAIRKAKGVTG